MLLPVAGRLMMMIVSGQAVSQLCLNVVGTHVRMYVCMYMCICMSAENHLATVDTCDVDTS